jgi:hypothetical protein
MIQMSSSDLLRLSGDMLSEPYIHNPAVSIHKHHSNRIRTTGLESLTWWVDYNTTNYKNPGILVREVSVSGHKKKGGQVEEW